MLQAAVCSEAGSALRLFVKLPWTVAFNADFGVCATPVRPSCGWYPTVGGGRAMSNYPTSSPACVLEVRSWR